MSRPVICDFCGRTHYDDGFAYIGTGAADEWLHHYQTGKDECPVCQEKRGQKESDAMWAKIRADMGLSVAKPSP
jgi:hypothetical protein